MAVAGGAGAFIYHQFERRARWKHRAVVVPKGEAASRSPRGSRARASSANRRMFIAALSDGRASTTSARNKPVQLKAGDYAIKQNASMRQVIECCPRGAATVLNRVTIPEGLTSQQIVER